MVTLTVADDPSLAPNVIFGAAALSRVEARFARHVLAAWDDDLRSLLPTGDVASALSQVALPAEVA